MVAILAFVAALVFIMFSTVFRGSFQPSSGERVPSVTGQIYSEVKENSDLLGEFTLEIVQEQASDKEAGTILEQMPTANSKYDGGSRVIQVVVSSGPGDDVLMPDLSGETLVSANSQLKTLSQENDLNLKIDFTTKTAYDDKVEKDHVISTIPAVGETLSKGDTVYLVISLGKETESVPMIDVLGNTLDLATKSLESMGLSVGSTESAYNNDYEEGEVCFQSVAKDTMVEKGTKINLIISLGPDPNSIPVPDEVTKTVTFTLPDTGSVVNVSVVDQDGNSVWDHQYDTSLQLGFEVDLKGNGQETFTLYVDGNKYSSQVVDFES